jgi:uridine phosphorylase
LKARGILDLSKTEWLGALGVSEDDVPVAVIVEGSWWREQRVRWRLERLEQVVELSAPDIFLGTWRGSRVAYCCAYGAARTAEVIQLFGCLGSRIAVQIGTCGGLQPDLKPGDIVVPSSARLCDGVGQLYAAGEASLASIPLSQAARRELSRQGLAASDGNHISWPTLFAQDGSTIETWAAEGISSVDMETATTYAVAAKYKVAAVSMLVVWDELTRGRTFLDALNRDEQAAVDRANLGVFEAGLALALEAKDSGEGAR